MMTKKQGRWIVPLYSMAVLALAQFAPLPAMADSFSVLDRQGVALSGTPVDVAVSSDGSWTFVLTTGGEVAIYGSRGELVQTLKVDKGFTNIEYNPAGNRIILSGSAKQELTVLTLAMVYDLDYSGSPFKGPQEAAVTIAVFNDFQ